MVMGQGGEIIKMKLCDQTNVDHLNEPKKMQKNNTYGRQHEITS
jgi:hypothetical protein